MGFLARVVCRGVVSLLPSHVAEPLSRLAQIEVMVQVRPQGTLHAELFNEPQRAFHLGLVGVRMSFEKPSASLHEGSVLTVVVLHQKLEGLLRFAFPSRRRFLIDLVFWILQGPREASHRRVNTIPVIGALRDAHIDVHW